MSSLLVVAGDSVGGHYTAALTFRWRKALQEQEELQSQRQSKSHVVLPPLKLQILLFPALQAVNLSTPSYVLNRQHPVVSKKQEVYYKATHLLGLEASRNRSLLDALYVSNHTTRATRERWASVFDALDEWVGSDALPEEDVLNATRLRADQREEHPEGDPVLERELLEKFASPEASPLLVESLDGVPDAYVATTGHDLLRDEGLLYVARLRKSRGIDPTRSIRVHHQHYANKYHAYLNFRPEVMANDLAAFVRDNPDFW